MAFRDRRLLAFAREMRHGPTPGEKALWAVLRGAQTGTRFRRQEPIGGFVVDFVCLPRRLVVEVDGERHDNARRKEADRHRDEVLSGLGFTVLRFAEWDARCDPIEVADEIWSHLPGNRRVPSVYEFAQE